MPPHRCLSAWSRMHCLSACSEALISAPSARRFGQWCAESVLHSLPAQSSRVRRPAVPPAPPAPPARRRHNSTSACEREEVALEPVAAVERPASRVRSSACSSAAERAQGRPGSRPPG